MAQPGQIVITASLAGTEYVPIDNGGPVNTVATAQQIANLSGLGGTTTATLIGTEFLPVQTAGSVSERITAANFNVWAVASGATTATIVGTEIVPIQSAAGVAEKITTLQDFSLTPTSTASFTTSAQTNSTSVTLSAVFTALTYTQTSTGNTVHLKAAPVNGEIQGFSVTNIVTNLTISSAANTVSAGAQGAAALGQAFWYRFNLGDTTWYRFG